MAFVEADPVPSELLRYLPYYKVVVCATCQYAIQPHATERHLKDIHKIHRARRRPFRQYIDALDLDEPKDVFKREISHFPVPLLPVRDGLKCQAADCGHLCRSEKRMMSHWYSIHRRAGQAQLDWRSAPLQTFFTGNLLKYFTAVESQQCILDNPTAYVKLLAPETNLSKAVLLSHFIAFTSISIAHDQQSVGLWQITVPKLALESPFLMHGILACSALHLAHQNPSEHEYLIQASNHHDVAMPLFRSAINNVDERSCHAIMAFSHLLVIYSFALEKQDERLLVMDINGHEFLPPWLYFLRNGCALVCSVWDAIQIGPVKQLAEQWEVPVSGAGKIQSFLTNHLLSMIPAKNSPDAWSSEECRVYADAASDLGRAFSCINVLGENFSTWDAVRIWPMLVSAEYIRLLSDRHPGALILLAHYCVLLKKVEIHWYFEGRTTKMMSAILQHLDSRWLSQIQGPLKVIGLSRSESVCPYKGFLNT